MDTQLVGRSIYALFVVAVLLVGLWYAARIVGRKRLTFGTGGRLVTVIESSYLSPQVMMHVVRVGPRYFAVGGGTGGVNLIAELERDDVDAWIATQRESTIGKVMPVETFLKRFRGG